MEEQISEYIESVDLTEDEDSCEAHSIADSPFDFVDCSRSLSESTSPVSQLDQSSSHFENIIVTSSSEATTARSIPKMLVKPTLKSVQITPNKKVRQFTSVQIKPPTITIPDTQDYDLQKADSSSSPQISNEVMQSTTIYTPKAPPGKLVVIKKNNKYYKIIIPHNVMPNISQSTGPVLINIPEVGSLVISNDPNADFAKDKPQQLSLNLDEIDQRDNGPPPVTNTINQIEEVLKDKKYCWTYISGRKRDLEGFSAYDRLGFYKSELLKARKCAKTLDSIISKCQLQLQNTIDKYGRFKKLLQKQDKVKLVKIRRIMKPSEVTKKDIQIREDFPPSFEQALLEPQVEIVEESDMENYGADLLLTKKVVILNHRKGIRKRGRPRKRKNFNLKSCYVHIVKDKKVEEYYKSLCNDGTKENVADLCRKSKMLLANNTVTPSTKNNFRAERKKIFNRMKSILMSKVIQTEELLKVEMNRFKPILILTEHLIMTRRPIEFYYKEFTRSNLIFVVNSNDPFPYSLMKDEGFMNAVEIGYVKLVNADLFCTYVKSGMNFSTVENESTSSDHNYSFPKSK